MTGTIGDITTGDLSVVGLSTGLDVDDLVPSNDFWIYPTYSIYQATGSDYTIDITLAVNTVAGTIEATGGTINIEGYLGDARPPIFPPELVPGNGTLLDGDVTNFGFTDIGVFEFVFESTGGDLTDSSYPVVNLSPIFGPVGSDIGVVLDPRGSFSVTSLDAFTGNFTYSSNEIQADTYAVPEPSTFISLVSLLLASICTVWRRKRTA